MPENTQGRYEAALASFDAWCLSVRLERDQLPDEVLDWAVADYLLEMIVDENFQVSLGLSLTAALRKRDPRLNLPVTVKLLGDWRKDNPPEQAAALPKQFVYAAFTLVWAGGEPALATLYLLCFCGLLRIGEGLKLEKRQVLFATSGERPAAVVMLGATKRGVDDKIELSNPHVVDALGQVCRLCDKNSGRLFAFSYEKVRRRLIATLSALGVDCTCVKTHSLRRGGATELYRQGVDLASIVVFGRWASEKSARVYIRQAEPTLLRLGSRLSPQQHDYVMKLAAAAALVPKAFPAFRR